MSEQVATTKPDGGAPVLSVREVEVRYGPVTAVRGPSFEVDAGQIVVVLGANGAGKSSLLKAVMGAEPIEAGEIRFRDEDLRRWPTHRRSRLGIGYVPEGRGVFPNMTVDENIEVGMRGAEQGAVRDYIFDLFPRLAERRTQLAGSMSGGEQQMLSLSRALAGQPDLLLIDELSLGLAPKVVERLFEKVGELRQTGISILLVEQFAHAALQVADYSGVFVRGEMTVFGPASNLARLSPKELAELYFGTGTRAESDGEQEVSTANDRKGPQR